ncbi:hypothetical protein [Streptomyces sp. Wh19]|uniref:Uncharacterized protein n=1 Tax=Streptomyces sanglieri TaxID=193460 RepID=A0ABW2X7W1_9ACTN|nr:hypothetical protein [Streptomyces sp. Wh19]MDV9195390.1 hypothetical protein [Streptomyces sp. Wh19]
MRLVDDHKAGGVGALEDAETDGGVRGEHRERLFATFRNAS